MGSILQVKNIETLYYGLIKALRGISLDIQEGTISVVLGGNGAGKTTTLKTIMGLLEDQPDKGTIEFMGKRIDGLDAEDIVNLGIAMVPEGREVFPELTVKENLWMGAYIRKDRAGVQEDLDRVIRYFPILKERSVAAGWVPERRRTTDVGYRAGADDPAETAHAGRAFLGVIPHFGAGDL